MICLSKSLDLRCIKVSTLQLTRFELTLWQVIDRYGNYSVTGYTTAGNIRLLLLHDGRPDDSIRQFFQEVHEVYLRVGQGRCSCRAGSQSTSRWWTVAFFYRLKSRQLMVCRKTCTPHLDFFVKWLLHI